MSIIVLNPSTGGGSAELTDAEVKTKLENNADTNTLTDAQEAKLDSLEGTKFKGTYTTLAALNSAHPNPEAGSYAHVDSGTSSEVLEVYIYDMDDEDPKWFRQLGQIAGETPTSVKTKLESNPDTNTITDAQESKLDNLPEIGDYTVIDETSINPTDYVLMADSTNAATRATNEDYIDFLEANITFPAQNAQATSYDNVTSGLVAGTVQEAIDELSTSSGGGSTYLSYQCTFATFNNRWVSHAFFNGGVNAVTANTSLGTNTAPIWPADDRDSKAGLIIPAGKKLKSLRVSLTTNNADEKKVAVAITSHGIENFTTANDLEMWVELVNQSFGVVQANEEGYLNIDLGGYTTTGDEILMVAIQHNNAADGNVNNYVNLILEIE